jgi:phosphoribosylanthranilate isomerase
MIEGIQLKVCGLSGLVDAELADRCGADFLGFILHPGSPRAVKLAQFKAMAPRLPERRKVAVSVEPSVEDLLKMRDAGFDRFQVHFDRSTPMERIAQWSEAVGAKALWLAPRLPPGSEFDPAWLPYAQAFMLDGFRDDAYGGTGNTADWDQFRRLRQQNGRRLWILAGGLNPANVGEALFATGARFVDANSGVEAAPGVKDGEKLKAFVAALHRAAARR